VAKSVAYAHQVVFRSNFATVWIPHAIPLVALLLASPWSVRYIKIVWKSAPETRPLLLFAPCLLAAYLLAALRGVMLFEWYAAPLVPFVLLLIGAAFRRLYPGVGYAVIIVMLWASLVGSDDVSTGREAAYIAMAHSLNLPSTVVIAAPEIGAFGYASRASVLDTIGLVSPVASRYYPLPPAFDNGAIPPALIRDEKPDYIVSLDAFVPPSMAESAWFKRDYHVIRTVLDPVPAFGAHYLLVYRSFGTGKVYRPLASQKK
jgi:hypothetical protein